MSGTHMRIKGLDRLRAGDLVEAHRDGVVHHRGIVEETVPALGVVWIHERTTGNRWMLDTDDFELRSSGRPCPLCEPQERR